MKRRLRRFLGVFLSLVLVLTLMPATCKQVKADTIGTVKGILTNDGTMYIVCDSNSYAINGTYNEKTITEVYDCDGGNGAMADYTGGSASPWYSNRANISAVVIGRNVTRIGNDSFLGCENMNGLTISDSVTSIGNAAFYGCRALGNITIPSTITFIDEQAFGECDALQSITIPATVLTWGDAVFWGCANLTEAIFEDGITTIPNRIFIGCVSLVDVTIPESVTVIDDGAFQCCEKLTTIVLPEGLTSIGEMAFDSCDRLTTISLPEGLTSIGNRAFHWCYSLTSITIPESVETIGENAFERAGFQSIEFMSNTSNSPVMGDFVFADVGRYTYTFNNNTGNWDQSDQNEPPLLIIPRGLYGINESGGLYGWYGGYFDVQLKSPITLNVNGGTINSGNVTTYIEGNVVTLPTDVTKEGYEFGGWYENSACSGDEITVIPATATGSKEYWAKWNPVTVNPPTPEPIETIYTISFDANGGTYLGDNLSVELFKTFDFAYEPGKIYRPGYLFSGWYTDPVEGVRIKSDTKFNGNVTTLYAHWIKVFTGKVWSFTARSYSKGCLTVRTEKPLTSVSGYEFEYSDDGVLWITRTKLIGKNDESATTMYFTNLTKGNYKVRVRAFRFDSTGNKIYGAWSKAVTVPVK